MSDDDTIHLGDKLIAAGDLLTESAHTWHSELAKTEDIDVEYYLRNTVVFNYEDPYHVGFYHRLDSDANIRVTCACSDTGVFIQSVEGANLEEISWKEKCKILEFAVHLAQWRQQT